MAGGRRIKLDVVYLAGGPTPSDIERLTGWPMACIPMAARRSLLESWLQAVEQAVARWRLAGDCRSRILLSPQSKWGGCDMGAGLGVAFDRELHRGTAGALRDALLSESASDVVLVIELSACPAVRLDGLFAAMEAIRGVSRACVIGESSLGRYCGVALFDRSLFDLVPEVGFFDLKEQLLPAVRKAGGLIEAVRVADRARRVRSRPEWLDAVQAWREFTVRSEVVGDCRPDWAEREGDRSVISPTAFTAGATVVSSIVMDEAVVEPGALVARSVIGSGMRVPAGARVIDAIRADPAAGEAVIRRSSISVMASAASK